MGVRRAGWKPSPARAAKDRPWIGGRNVVVAVRPASPDRCRETISLPADRFAGFDELKSIPNNVYRLYSERWGITIGRAAERLTAVPASTVDAALLRCGAGAPLLRIERIAYDLEDRPVELRISRCLTREAHYVSDLR